MNRGFQRRLRVISLSLSLVLVPLSGAKALASAGDASHESASETESKPANEAESAGSKPATLKGRADKVEMGGTISSDKINKLLQTEDVYGENFKVSTF